MTQVSILIPARNEASNISAALHSVLGQTDCPAFEVLVVDDDSDDETAAIVAKFAQDSTPERPVKLISLLKAPPAKWLGKPRACHVLAKNARGAVLVFLDADVRLMPDAVGKALRIMHDEGFQMLSPYPRQKTAGVLGRLIQPLLQWSWLTFLPLRLSEDPRTLSSLTAANGQFLLCDKDAYWSVGGHRAVAGEVIEDLALARVFKSFGHRVGMANGTDMAICQMYDDDSHLITGYSKSLWRAFGSPFKGICAGIALTALYVLPAVGLFSRDKEMRFASVISYGAATAQRILSARSTGSQVLPDAVAQPVSIAALFGLMVNSIIAHKQGRLIWRGRKV